MAADENRSERFVLASAYRENIPQPVDGDATTGVFAPADELVAHFLVGGGERKPAQAAGTARTDLPGAHQRAPQALPVHLQKIASVTHYI